MFADTINKWIRQWHFFYYLSSANTRSMKLADKGPIQPPPTLTGPAQDAAERVLQWTEIIAATHWDLYKPTAVDGTDFYVGEEELGHIHLDGTVHLATPPDLGLVLVEKGLAKRFPYGGPGYEGWVLYRIRTDEDAGHAAWLFKLNYDWLRGTPVAALRRRISGYARKARTAPPLSNAA